MNEVKLSGIPFKGINVYQNDKTTIAKFLLDVGKGKFTQSGIELYDRIPCIAFGNVAEQIGSINCTDKTYITIEGTWSATSYQKNGAWVNAHQCVIQSFSCDNPNAGTTGNAIGNTYMQQPMQDDYDLPFV